MIRGVNRRSILVGAMAALPATAGPGRAQRGPEAPDAGPQPPPAPATPAELARYHLDAYKAAMHLVDPTIKNWWRGVPEDDNGVAFYLIAQR